jgi:hypothetical protein
LVWFADDIFYVTRSSKIIRRMPRGDIRSGTFGPGKDRVTLLSLDNLSIFLPNLWPKEGSSASEAPKPEWQANAQNLTLFTNGDEDGVVAYSHEWIFRLTEGSSSWPNVVMQLLDLPIVVPKPPKRPGTVPFSLYSADLHRNTILHIAGTNRVIDFSKNVSNLGKSTYPSQWISTWHFTPCLEASAGGTSTPGGTQVVNRMGKSTTFGANDDVAASWRDVLCDWVAKSGRRVGTQ